MSSNILSTKAANSAGLEKSETSTRLGQACSSTSPPTTL